MAISGTMAAGDMVTFENAEVGIDIGDSGSYVAVRTWTTDVRVTRGTRPTAAFSSHGGVREIATGTRPEDTIEIDFFYTEGSTDPFKNLVDVFEGTGSQLCDVQFNKSGATTGDLQFTTTAAKISGISFPPMAANDATPSTFTLTLVGYISTAAIA